MSDFDEASENLDADSDNELADGMLLDAEDLDTPFFSTELQDDLVVEGDEFERPPHPIIPPSIRRRLPRRSFLAGGK